MQGRRWVQAVWGALKFGQYEASVFSMFVDDSCKNFENITADSKI
jgi:hypothetical protein